MPDALAHVAGQLADGAAALPCPILALALGPASACLTSAITVDRRRLMCVQGLGPQLAPSRCSARCWRRPATPWAACATRLQLQRPSTPGASWPAAPVQLPRVPAGEPPPACRAGQSARHGSSQQSGWSMPAVPAAPCSPCLPHLAQPPSPPRVPACCRCVDSALSSSSWQGARARGRRGGSQGRRASRGGRQRCGRWRCGRRVGQRGEGGPSNRGKGG